MLTFSFCSPTSPAYSPTSPKFSCVRFAHDCHTLTSSLRSCSRLPSTCIQSDQSCVLVRSAPSGRKRYSVLTFLFPLQSDFAAVLADESGVLAHESGILPDEPERGRQDRKCYPGRKRHSERTERALLVERFMESMRGSLSDTGRVSVCLYDHDCRNAKTKIDVWVWPRDGARLVARKPVRPREALREVSFAAASLRPSSLTFVLVSTPLACRPHSLRRQETLNLVRL